MAAQIGRVLGVPPAEVFGVVEFYTGVMGKRRSMPGSPKYVICNADEDEPDAFKEVSEARTEELVGRPESQRCER